MRIALFGDRFLGMRMGSERRSTPMPRMFARFSSQSPSTRSERGSFFRRDRHFPTSPAPDASVDMSDQRATTDGLRPATAAVTNDIQKSGPIRNIRKRCRVKFGGAGRALLNVTTTETVVMAHHARHGRFLNAWKPRNPGGENFYGVNGWTVAPFAACSFRSANRSVVSAGFPIGRLPKRTVKRRAREGRRSARSARRRSVRLPQA